MTTAIFNPDTTMTNAYGLWQYDYGQVLRIQGLHLPSAVEIHFSLHETGGALAFMVSIVVQVIKEMPFLAKIPTSAVALITSMILCPVALVVLCTYFKITITWYYVFASFLAAFIVYLVSTGGWEKIKEIWDRTKYKDSEGE